MRVETFTINEMRNWLLPLPAALPSGDLRRRYKGYRAPGKRYPFSSARQIDRNKRQFKAGQIKFR